MKALFHEDQYVGYRVTVAIGDQIIGVVDVTGAASRSLPLNDARAHAENERDLGDFDRVKPAEDWDAPAESGNFPNGFGPTASQAARYAAFRRQQGGTVQP